MTIIDSIFDGLLGYEKLMLICGFILFVFALLAITLMIVQRRNFKMALTLIVFAIMLMGFPGIQSIKFSQDMAELNLLRSQPAPATDPAQQHDNRELLGNLQQRAANNPQLLAQVSDGYRAIGEVDKAYDLASAVLKDKPSAAVQTTLIPVLTAKLNHVQDAPSGASPPTTPETPSAASVMIDHVPAPLTADVAAATPAAPIPVPEGVGSARPAVVPDSSKQREIAKVAAQLQSVAAPLPAASHVALANAYVKLGEPQKAKTNVELARRLDPHVRLNATLQRTLQPGH